jgi:hypothetical protein
LDKEILVMKKRNIQVQSKVIIPPPGNLGGDGLSKNEALPPDLEVGTTGLAQFSGLIFQEPLVELRGREACKRYNEMRLNSPIIGAALLSIENPLRSTSWNFTSEDGADDPRLELLDRARKNLDHSWNDFVSEVVTMLPFGYSIFETVFEQVGTEILWKRFSSRGQDTVYRWLFEEEKNTLDDPSPKQRLVGFVQLAPPHYQLTPIPIDRLMLFRTRVERDNPEGRSMLRQSWVPYYYIKHIQQIEAIGIERDLAGLPVIKLPPGASTGGADTDDAKAAKIVRNLRNDEQSGVVLLDGWELELLSTGGSRALDTDKIVNRYEKRMLTSFLAQFLMLGQDGIGSLSLSKDQSDFFTMSVNSVADIIAETFTKTAIVKLMELNGYTADGLALEHTPAQGETGVTVAADFLQKVGPYLTLGPEDEVWLRQIINMPEKSIEAIQAEAEEKQAAAQAAALAMQNQKMQQGQNQQQAQMGQSGEAIVKSTQPNGMIAEQYGAAAVDDAKRRKMEREWQKAVQVFFDAQKKRILKAAKEIQK